jgi:hypothetical protein
LGDDKNKESDVKGFWEGFLVASISIFTDRLLRRTLQLKQFAQQSLECKSE